MSIEQYCGGLCGIPGKIPYHRLKLANVPACYAACLENNILDRKMTFLLLRYLIGENYNIESCQEGWPIEHDL